VSALPSEGEQVHRYTVQEYDELVGRGFFGDARVELIHGLVLDMSPKSPAHENVIEWLNDWLTARIDRSRFRVRVASSLQTSDSQPELDLAVVDRDRPKGQRPRRAHLVIEVAHSSRHRDLVLKPVVYAEAADEYWVVDLDNREVVVHRDAGRRGYRQITVHGPDAALAPQALGTEPITFAGLFDAA
jgi:Uma2 family endonuclease